MQHRVSVSLAGLRGLFEEGSAGVKRKASTSSALTLRRLCTASAEKRHAKAKLLPKASSLGLPWGKVDSKRLQSTRKALHHYKTWNCQLAVQTRSGLDNVPTEFIITVISSVLAVMNTTRLRCHQLLHDPSLILFGNPTMKEGSSHQTKVANLWLLSNKAVKS